MDWLVRLDQHGLHDAREMEDGSPLSLASSLPDDLAVKKGGDFSWREIAMEVEVLCVTGLIAAA